MEDNGIGFDAFDLSLAILQCEGSSAYRNDRDRPYDGQPHTDSGIRGKTEVKGLTFRDIRDCFVQGILAASGDPIYQRTTTEINNEFKNTEYASDGTWRQDYLYNLDFDNIDPLAAWQNMSCFMEDMMGIYPNVPKLFKNDDEI